MSTKENAYQLAKRNKAHEAVATIEQYMDKRRRNAFLNNAQVLFCLLDTLCICKVEYIAAKCDEQRAEGQRAGVQQGEHTVAATGRRLVEKISCRTFYHCLQSASRNGVENTSNYSMDSDRTPTQGNPQMIRMPQR